MRLIGTIIGGLACLTFLGSIITAIIKLILFRDYKDTYLRILNYGVVTALAGLIIEHGMEQGRKDYFISFSLMCLGLLVGTLKVFKSKPEKIKSPE